MSVEKALSSKICVVTGASRGLGRSVALALAKQGAKIAIVARSRAPLDELAAQIGKNGAEALAISADITDQASARVVFDAVKDKWGSPQILINNAGHWLAGPFEDVEIADARKLMDVNFWGAFHCAQESYRRMKRNGGGHIVNVISTAGLEGKKNETVYCASKYALSGLSEALNAEGKSYNIRVTSFFPGGMKTPFWEGHDVKTDAFMNPDDVAGYLVQSLVLPSSMIAEKLVLKRFG